MKFLRDLTVGHYYPVGSAIHSLDPRVKLIGLLLCALTLFTLKTLWGLALFLVGSIWVVRWAHLPLLAVVRGLRPFAGLFVLTACLQLFFTPGEHPLFVGPGPVSITREGLRQAIRIGGQLSLFILLSSVFTLTTSPLELLRGLEKITGPLARLKIPVSEICLAMLLCVRFLPILGQEAQRIQEAQLARGIDPYSGSLSNRLRKFHGIFLPLLYNVVWRAEELATAMAVRGYGEDVEKQTLKYMRLSTADFMALAIVTSWCIALFLFFHG
jgi:energy-coupling factor transport system permease protein